MASDTRKDDVAYAMTPFKLMMWSVGTWPLQVYDIYSLIRCLSATCCLIVLVVMLSFELQMGCTDAQQNIDILMFVTCAIIGVLKNIWFRIYSSNLIDNYTSAVDDYLTAENEEQRAIMRRHAFFGRALCSIVIVAYIDGCIYGIIPFVYQPSTQINESAVMIYTVPSTCVLEYLKAPRSIYRIICFIEFFLLYLITTSNCGNDSIFLHITLHVCGQVKILNDKLANFDVKGPQVRDRFGALIKRHNHLMRMARKLDEAISFILLAQLFISCILICVIGFQIILALKGNNFVLVMKSFMVLGTVMAQLFTYSLVGDYLIVQMEEVGLAIYRCAWYDLPATMSRNLNFVILQAQSPVKLQAGYFMVINLSSYMSILKTSMSYLSVLRVMVET